MEKLSACEWLQIHSFGNPVPYRSQRHQHSDKLLPHAVKKKSWRSQESVVNSPWLTLSKEQKKVLISWDTSWHSLDYRSSVTSAHHRDHWKVRSYHSSVTTTLRSNHCLQITGSINPNPSEHSYLTSGHFNHSS